MKKKAHFICDCGIGFILIAAILWLVFTIKSGNGFNIIPFIAPLLFVPLFVSVVHSKNYSCYKKAEDKPGRKGKSLCVFVTGGFLLIVTLISGFVLYFGW